MRENADDGKSADQLAPTDERKTKKGCTTHDWNRCQSLHSDTYLGLLTSFGIVHVSVNACILQLRRGAFHCDEEIAIKPCKFAKHFVASACCPNVQRNEELWRNEPRVVLLQAGTYQTQRKAQSQS